ncbi:16S rRNA (guanine(966)-N(2))-methyltransferase RsmD [Halomonas sp. SSL-5]|uniref:16S rRNA (guanine(966)-N(2))-methyltransferase RsmD n=1 Tax=Halomonas sp. SSL-5 TaxID=3065855 RepID=UPI0027394749|nr:16S rRNA (guanine(966)-N(2))-methyltransferase RsmD [Halomonas sp. SSL-5]MDY7117083.1 16S rRNA (guanine(966)-N(2))-methyltransferase RsmD [Halomonas sp. SSL-5]
MTRRPPRSRRSGKPATARQHGGKDAGRRRAGRRSAGRLRIIGGDYRRRLLPVLDSPGLRPTPDRVRETLFNWLSAALPGARVLDLFAGTGSLGLEALSRGAREATFVEHDARVADQLTENLATLGATERGRVINADVTACLGGAPSPATLIFLDPPFRQGLAEPCCAALESGWLAADALIYLETEAELTPEVPATWQLHREVRAGDSHGRLYRRMASRQDDAC